MTGGLASSPDTHEVEASWVHVVGPWLRPLPAQPAAALPFGNCMKLSLGMWCWCGACL